MSTPVENSSGALPPFTLKGPITDPSPGLDAAALVGKAIDLGGQLLGERAERVQGESCRELWAAYEAQKERRASTADRATERAKDAGKGLLDSVKGLFD